VVAALVPDPKVATPFLKSLAGIMSAWMPKVLCRGPVPGFGVYLLILVFVWEHSQLRVTKLDPDLVCREPAVVQNYKADPLVYHGASLVFPFSSVDGIIVLIIVSCCAHWMCQMA
jgi:hypothetical protein